MGVVQTMKEANKIEILRAFKEMMLFICKSASGNIGENKSINLMLKVLDLFELILTGSVNYL